MEEDCRWYVIHTYSGYENKVKANIEKIVENRNMREQIHEISVPTVGSIEIRNGSKKEIQKKVFPGYVFLKMVMNDDTWYVVRNTRGVTSFVGSGSKPIPLTEEEVKTMGIESNDIESNINLGDTIKIMGGFFEGSTGTVQYVNLKKETVMVKLVIFGRETPVELGFTEILKVTD
jgi:transcriptional antiterminator NusG